MRTFLPSHQLINTSDRLKAMAEIELVTKMETFAEGLNQLLKDHEATISASYEGDMVVHFNNLGSVDLVHKDRLHAVCEFNLEHFRIEYGRVNPLSSE